MTGTFANERPAYLRFLPAFLFRTDAHPLRYLLKAWPMSLLPAAALLAIVAGFTGPQAEAPGLPTEGAPALLLMVLAAPLLETLLMAPALLLLARFFGPGPAVVANAALWGLLHSLAAPVWGLVIWWPFLIFSITMLTWRSRGIAAAFLVTAALHGLHNSVPAVAVILLG